MAIVNVVVVAAAAVVVVAVDLVPAVNLMALRSADVNKDSKFKCP